MINYTNRNTGDITYRGVVIKCPICGRQGAKSKIIQRGPQAGRWITHREYGQGAKIDACFIPVESEVLGHV